jgi:hypothetical protein
MEIKYDDFEELTHKIILFSYFYNLTKKLKKMSTVLSNRPAKYKIRTYIQKCIIANRRLRSGDVSRISQRTGYSKTHVHDVLKGKEFNTKIMNKAFDMLRGRIQNSELI